MPANVCSVWTVWCAMHQCNASVRATEYKQLSWDHLSLSLEPQIKKLQNKELGYLKLKLIILCVCAGHATFLNSRGKRLACQNKSHQGRPRSMNCDKFLAASSRGARHPKWHFLTRVLAPFANVNICQETLLGKIQQNPTQGSRHV